MDKRYRTQYPSDVSNQEWAFVGTLSDLVPGGRAAARARVAGGVQRAPLHRAHRQPVALHAGRSAAVDGGLPSAARSGRTDGIRAGAFRAEAAPHLSDYWHNSDG
jgi:hypothetical protein